MSIISCELRAGRTDEQKRALSQGLTQAVPAVTDEPLSEMSMVIREGRGINFIEVGEHLANRRLCSHE
ncbi:4-oxalocrotonate tautomerase family protein [Streptomyces sp. NPDC056390]|uniref:tautomerase family protein n=1 Tax=unclassified Streptomyces TaxID=2593676 RepID=UPI0035DCB98C